MKDVVVDVAEEAGSGHGWSDPSLSVTDGSGEFFTSLRYREEEEEEDVRELEEEFLVDTGDLGGEDWTTGEPPVCVSQLARHQLCDSLHDCPDGEDEQDCEYGHCLPSEFSCLSGTDVLCCIVV